MVFGRIGLGSTGSFNLSSLNGTNGFVMNGEAAVTIAAYQSRVLGMLMGMESPTL